MTAGNRRNTESRGLQFVGFAVFSGFNFILGELHHGYTPSFSSTLLYIHDHPGDRKSDLPVSIFYFGFCYYIFLVGAHSYC